MTEIKVDKIEAAKRQIELSIRLLFQNEDIIGIHTLAAAGLRILHDLGGIKPDSQIHQHLKNRIKPGMEGRFWKVLNYTANFLKHADRDPYDVLEDFKEKTNDFFILFACFYYQDLGYKWTPEMVAFVSWYSILNPGILEVLYDDPIMKNLAENEEISVFRQKSRSEQLAFGKTVLERAYTALKNI